MYWHGVRDGCRCRDLTDVWVTHLEGRGFRRLNPGRVWLTVTWDGAVMGASTRGTAPLYEAVSGRPASGLDW